MIYCSNCGRELTPGARFCPVCGTPVPAEPISNNNAGAPAPQSAPPFNSGSQAAQIPPPAPNQQPQTPNQQPQPQNQQQFPDQQQTQAPNQPFVDPYGDGQAQKLSSSQTEKKKSKGVIAGIIAAIVLLAGAGGTVGYLLVKGDKDSSSSSKSKSSKTSTTKPDDEDDTTRPIRTTKKATEPETTEPETEEATTAATTEKKTETTTEAPTEPPKRNGLDPSVGTGGDQFTIVSWDANDAPYLIDLYEDNGGKKAAFRNLNCTGDDASEKLDALFNRGEDIDLYFCEADWASTYVNDDSRTLDLSMLGFRDDAFTDIYGYTDTVGIDSSGVRKGVSWQSCPGGFAYRTDLAEEYLGVTSPEEMQAKISDWDGFVNAAWTIAGNSGGKVALADSLGGMWQAYSSGMPFDQDMADRFTKYAEALWSCGGVAKCYQWGDSWTENGRNDKTMGYFVSTWGLGGFFRYASDESYGRWAMCQGPSPYFWGGTWMVVNPRTDNGEEAREFIYNTAINDSTMAEYALSKPEFVNNTIVMDELINGSWSSFNTEIMGNFGGQNVYKVLSENARTAQFTNKTASEVTRKRNYIKNLTDELGAEY